MSRKPIKSLKDKTIAERLATSFIMLSFYRDNYGDSDYFTQSYFEWKETYDAYKAELERRNLLFIGRRSGCVWRPSIDHYWKHI